MKRVIGIGILVLTALGLARVGVAKEEAQIDKAAPDFTLVDTKGKEHSLSDYKGRVVVLEWTNMECPFVKKHYNSGNMQMLQKTYAKKGVVWLRICSSAPGTQGYFETDVIEKRIKQDKALQSAYLIDDEGNVGRMYGAKTTPHMYVIDPKGTLIYAGGIDDKPSTNLADIKTANNYVSACLDAVLSGEPVETKTSKPYGCSVKYAKK
jgi:peroxiredoxin